MRKNANTELMDYDSPYTHSLQFACASGLSLSHSLFPLCVRPMAGRLPWL
jgi:hypothetical protein